MNIQFGPFKLHDHHLADYMHRWLLYHPFGTIRLHNIRRPDADVELHDHPWDFVSIILRGGYTEAVAMPGTRPQDNLWQRLAYRRGAILYRKATDCHKIEAVEPNTWTLVFSGSRVRSWGFWSYNGFVTWRDFKASRKNVDPIQYEQRLRETGVLE